MLKRWNHGTQNRSESAEIEEHSYGQWKPQIRGHYGLCH